MMEKLGKDAFSSRADDDYDGRKRWIVFFVYDGSTCRFPPPELKRRGGGGRQRAVRACQLR
jgi:hypothetical protein